MKHKIYFLTLLSIFTAMTNNSFSQNYQSLFGDTSTTWDIIPHGYCDAICSQTIIVGGDTIISSNTYKIISGLSGFVREDTIQGKAWFYDTDNNTEYLVMDLGLTLGDTFNLYDYNNIPTSFIVDSVYFVNSLKHVRLDAWTMMCGLNEKITFIEGSGTTASFNYQRYLNGNFVNSYMLCHQKDGVKVAGNFLFMDTCYVCLVGTQEYYFDANSVNIFPNPTLDYLNIETKNGTATRFYLRIYNIVGEEIISHKIIDNLTTISVSDLTKGVYIMVVDNNISKYHQRLIKQ